MARSPRRPPRRRAPDRRGRLPASRSYSIASAPEHDAVELTIERFEDGEVSRYLVDDVIADQFEVRGPIGGPFTWSVDEGGPLYLIGGGSGMVPLMAMLRHREAHPEAQLTAHVLVSNRSVTAAIYTTELETLTAREKLHVAWTYTRQAPDGWRGWTRRVDDAILRAAGPPDDAAKAATRVFVCGPTPFVGTVTRLLVDQGLTRARSAPRTSARRAEGIVGADVRSDRQSAALQPRHDASRSAW